jgi:hypothetical protein
MRKTIRAFVLIMTLAIPVFADDIPNGVTATAAGNIPNDVTLAGDMPNGITEIGSALLEAVLSLF